ncbi:MAG: CHAT domain-containing protein [Planctomycetaceae bacterium]|nr:CHAT domain-containing protein [Planctomycetaceae bacterium]
MKLALVTSTVFAAEGTPTDAQPLLRYIADDVLGLIYARPHSLIQDTEQEVLGDIPYLGRFPVPPSAMERVAICLREKKGSGVYPTILLQFRFEIPSETLVSWLLPGAQRSEHFSGYPYYQLAGQSNEDLFGFTRMIFPAPGLVILSGEDLDLYLDAVNDPTKGALYEQMTVLDSAVNFAALADVGQIRLFADTAPPFLTLKSVNAVMSMPAELSVASLEAVFGKRSNEMQIRLVPHEGVSSLQPITNWAEQPGGVVANVLHSLTFYRNNHTPADLFVELDQQLDSIARFFESFSISKTNEEVVLVTEQAPSVSRALSSTSQVLGAAVQIAREAARSRQLMNNYKQLLLALANYADQENRFAKDITDDQGTPLLSWRVRILPQLGYEELYNQFRFDEPWNSEHNRQLLTLMPEFYRDLWDSEKVFETRVLGVTGKGTVLSSARNYSDVIDGASVTAALVESKTSVPWTRPVDLPLQKDIEKQLEQHGGQTLFGYLDGHVAYANITDEVRYEDLLTINDGAIVDVNLLNPAEGRTDESIYQQYIIDASEVDAILEQLQSGDREQVKEAFWKLVLNEQLFTQGGSAPDTKSTEMKSILLAWHNHHDLYGIFPPDVATPDKKAGLSWRVRILPLLGEEELFNEFHFEEPWDSEHNKQLLEKIPDVYANPEGQLPAGTTRFVSVRGKGTIFTDRVELKEVTDGASLTGVLVEAQKAVPWTKPEDLELQEKFDSLLYKNSAGLHRIGFADGSTHDYESQPDEVYRSLFLYSDGAPKVLNDVDDVPQEPSAGGNPEDIQEIAVELLFDEDPYLQSAGARLFWLLTPKPQYAETEFLQNLMRHDVVAVRNFSQDRMPFLVGLLFGSEGKFNQAYPLLLPLAQDPSAVIPFLDNPDLEIRTRAIKIIGQIGSGDFLDVLSPLANDPEVGATAQAAINAIQERVASLKPELTPEDEEALIGQRDQLWDTGQQLIQEEKYAEGIANVEQMLEIEQKVFGEAGDVPLKTNEWIINNARASGLYDVVINQQKKRVTMLEMALDPNDVQIKVDEGLVTTYEQEAKMTPEQLQEYNDIFNKDAQLKELINEEKLPEAIEFLESIIEARRKLVGPDSLMIVANLRQLRQLYFQTEQYPKAFEVAQELVRVATLLFGEDAPVVQSDRSEMIYLQQFAGNPNGIVEQLIELQKIPDEKLKVDTAAQDSRYIGLQLSNSGRVEESLYYLKRAHRLNDQIQNQDRVGEVGKVIGMQLQQTNPEESAFWLAESVWRYRQSNPFQGYYANYPVLAEMMRAAGKPHLEMVLRQALTDALRQGTQTKQVSMLNFVKTLPPLAETYIRLGDYQTAEQVLRECGQLTGDYRDDPFVIEMLTQQAIVNDYFGAEEVARQLYENALEQSKKSTEPFLAYLPYSLQNLGEFHLRHNRLQEALVYVQAASEILAQKQNADYVESLGLVGKIQHLSGNQEEAFATAELGTQQLVTLNIPVREKRERHQQYADLWLKFGKYDKALEQAQTALQLALDLEGESSLHYSQAMETVARIQFAKGDQQAAVSTSLEALQKGRETVDQTAYLLSPRQQLLYADTMRGSLDLFLTIAASDPNAAEISFEQILQWKGAGLIHQHAIHQQAAQANLAPFFEQIEMITGELASLDVTTSASTELQHLERLNQVEDLLENQLSAARFAYVNMREPITLDQFVELLPKDGVFVDYYIYQDQTLTDTQEQGAAILASVIKPGGEIQLLPLGRVERVRQSLIVWQKTLGASSDSRRAGDILRTILWDPLLPHLGKSNLILISPENILGRVPFQALPTPKGDRYLIELYKIGLVSVPQLLPELLNAKAEPAAGEILLMGNISYDLEPNTDFTENLLNRSLLEGSHFAAIPGTGEEIASILQIFGSTHPDATGQELRQLTHASATEQAFRQAVGQFRNLHIATHGYFLEQDRDAEGDSIRNSNPELMSGLALAGANNRDHDAIEDGLLTAAEIVALDLEHVDLTVLSSCETGLEAETEGEGLIGIQRSFQVAGSGATIASLWQAPDQTTRVLMERFYLNYWEKKMSRLDALREAQIFLLNTPEAITNPELIRGDRGGQSKTPSFSLPKRFEPEFWAGFMFSGDWR